MFRFTIRDLLWLMVVVAIVLVAFFVKSNRPTRWEYNVDYNISDPTLNKYGDEGWELVSVAPTRYEGSAAFYFKKRK